MVTPDKDGWVYTSTHWDISNGNLDDKSNNNYTRRRRWIRKCKKM
jgi:hypothetical protein